MDQLTLDRISKAHPRIREQLAADYIQANNLLGQGCRLRFSYVLRTNAEQDALYALGRTQVNSNGKSSKKPLGYIVTNAKGGQSIHNYGLAFDIVLMYDKNKDGTFETVSWDMVKDGDNDGKADWMEIADFFKSKGYEWGGDWKSFKDYPHFQMSFGFNWRTLLARQYKGITLVDNCITYVKI
jgi:peptidoglycan L-alanyl-D-glutamate endopeptidase CwlK